MRGAKRAMVMAICAGLVALAGAPAARAAFDDPLFFYTPQTPPTPPPTGYLDGPCGLAVASNGWFYVSDYYHRAIDAFEPPAVPVTNPPTYKGQPLSAYTGAPNPHTGPVDDPCGLDFDSSGTLYLDDYHREVVRFPAPLSLSNPSNAVIDSGDPSDPFANPTGVAVDPTSDDVYVDDRTYVAAYDENGDPLDDGGGGDLRIGEGSLGEGYGIAVSGFAPTAGYLYVPDAAADTVKVFDPSFSTTTPKATITGPTGGFGSLRDSAVAVDDASGEIYVADTLGPQLSEEPQAIVYVFAANGSYEGRLKHNTIAAAPVGLAVDNSGGSGQGRVYLTSGITENAGIYAYPPGAATNAVAPPLGSFAAPGGGGGSSSSAPGALGALGAAAAGGGGEAGLAAAGASAIAQKGTLRLTLAGKLAPKRLPRVGTAPIAVSVGGQISTTDQSLPPQLKTMRIELNRHGQLDTAGLPTCPYDAIQPGSSSRALAACRSALVGKGSFSAEITLAGQDPYPTEGRLLLFNGTRHGRPVLYGHIYAPHPFATSFVIVFAVQKLGRGAYGTALSAPMPKAMDSWGRLTGIEMTLARRYSSHGRPHSYLSSGCPAPKGFPGASFPLARASFAFAGGQSLSSVLSGDCKVRR